MSHWNTINKNHQARPTVNKIILNTMVSDYKPEEEHLLKEWSEKAQCYRILHDWSHEQYKNEAAWFTIPVIILSTLTGTANFAQNSIPLEYRGAAPMAIGTINILAGIITTISQFLRVSELQEGHRVASLSWGKYSRNIKTELIRHPKDRTPVLEMMKISKQEYDRLMESSPAIPLKQSGKFIKKFKGKVDLVMPEICDGIMPTIIYTARDDDRIANMVALAGSKFSELSKSGEVDEVLDSCEKGE